jgi:hypothetical protein
MSTANRHARRCRSGDQRLRRRHILRHGLPDPREQRPSKRHVVPDPRIFGWALVTDSRKRPDMAGQIMLLPSSDGEDGNRIRQRASCLRNVDRQNDQQERMDIAWPQLAPWQSTRPIQRLMFTQRSHLVSRRGGPGHGCRVGWPLIVRPDGDLRGLPVRAGGSCTPASPCSAGAS